MRAPRSVLRFFFFQVALRVNVFMPSRALSLYRGMLRHGARFAENNFRQYALRRARTAFREHRAETDPARVEQLLAQAEEQLAIVKRQAVISALYPQEPTVVGRRQ